MTAEIIQYKEPRALTGLATKPPAVFLSDEKAPDRFFGFFTANIRNKNTRRAYYKAACRFSAWCEGRGLLDLAQVKPPHVAAYIEWLGLREPQGQGLSKPSVKQHLAALRMLFDWLESATSSTATRLMPRADRSIHRRKARRRCSTATKRARYSR